MAHSPSPTSSTWFNRVSPGKVDLRVFDQCTYWITAQPEVLRLDAMTSDHLSAVLVMLEAYALRFHLRVLCNLSEDLLHGFYTGQPSSEALLYDLTGESSADATPVQWLNATPLVRQIRKLLL